MGWSSKYLPLKNSTESMDLGEQWKKGPWLCKVYRGWRSLPSYVAIILNHKDPPSKYASHWSFESGSCNNSLSRLGPVRHAVRRQLHGLLTAFCRENSSFAVWPFVVYHTIVANCHVEICFCLKITFEMAVIELKHSVCINYRPNIARNVLFWVLCD